MSSTACTKCILLRELLHQLPELSGGNPDKFVGPAGLLQALPLHRRQPRRSHQRTPGQTSRTRTGLFRCHTIMKLRRCVPQGAETRRRRSARSRS